MNKRSEHINSPGFTLMEMMIIVILIGLVAAFGIPNYQKTVRKARERTAIANLVTIYGSNEVYRARTGEYVPGAALNLGGINSALAISIVDSSMTYSYTRATPTTYTVTAAWAGTVSFTIRARQDLNVCCFAGTCSLVAGCGGGGGCFLAGTEIAMADNTVKPIEDIKVGDMVSSFDEQTGKVKEGKVINVPVHPKEGMFLVINDHLKVTPVHRVLSKGEWIAIGELKIGDTLTSVDGEDIPIERIDLVSEMVDVYDLGVSPYNTYIANGLIVHNQVVFK